MKTKQQKQKEARERQERHELLSLKERWKKLDVRGCTAKRERAKIRRQMEEENKNVKKNS